MIDGEQRMDEVAAEEFRIFCGHDINPDDWLWCSRCHKCYRASEFRKSKDKGRVFLLCHYKDCDGDLPLDSRRWSKLIQNNPALPRGPLRHRVYEISSEPRDE